MAESGKPPDPTAPAPGPEALARDWITLWQSELAAIAADREAQESWQAILALWAGAAGAMLAAAPRFWAPQAGHAHTDPSHASPPRAGPDPVPHSIAQPQREHADGRPCTTASQGAAPAAAAPDPRDAEVDRLARHIAELESRLAELEHSVRRGDSGHRRGAAGPGPRRQRR